MYFTFCFVRWSALHQSIFSLNPQPSLLFGDEKSRMCYSLSLESVVYAFPSLSSMLISGTDLSTFYDIVSIYVFLAHSCIKENLLGMKLLENQLAVVIFSASR